MQFTGPAAQEIGAKANLWHRGPHLLTAGAVNWSSQGSGIQPVVEYGFYASRDHLVIGGIRAGGRTEGILGFSHQFTERLQVAVDYQSGPGNALTFGFAFNLTDALQVNPAVYFANTRPHAAMGYVVLTWTRAVWR